MEVTDLRASICPGILGHYQRINPSAYLDIGLSEMMQRAIASQQRYIRNREYRK
jgi:hypothetical protein